MRVVMGEDVKLVLPDRLKDLSGDIGRVEAVPSKCRESGGELAFDPRRTRDAPPEAIARRRAAFRELSDMIASLPILDSGPVHEIVDDINAE